MKNDIEVTLNVDDSFPKQVESYINRKTVAGCRSKFNAAEAPARIDIIFENKAISKEIQFIYFAELVNDIYTVFYFTSLN